MAKRRKMPAITTGSFATPDPSPKEELDVSGFTIDDAFAYQASKQMNLEEFINVVATKMKFKVSNTPNDST